MLSLFSKKKLGAGLIVFSLGVLSIFYNNFGIVELSNSKQLNESNMEDLFIPGRLLLQSRPGVSDESIQQLIRSHGGKQIAKISQINLHIVELPPQASEKAVEALLAHHPLLNFAERDRYIKPVAIADDPYYINSWHLPKINAPLAWDMTQGDGIIIAILDSGVDPTHPDLVSKLVDGYNFYDNNTNTADVYGHGTKCAGAAAAIGNNSTGVTGVSWNSKIMPIRVTGTDGWATWSGLAKGLTYAADHGVRVASMSFLNPSSSSSVVSAAAYLKSKGGIAVGAYGNNGSLDSTPNTSDMIIVTATDGNDVRPSWSTYGPSADIAAPGVGIYVTNNGGGYGSASGTSFSTPIVAGAIALMMSANSNLKPSQIENILFSTALDLGDSGWDQYYGNGRVDAGAAVELAKSTQSYDTTIPSVSFSSPVSGSKVNGLVSISVSASDNVSVSRVELYVNSTLLASDNQAPYNFSFDSVNFSDGNTSLTAKAIDSAGNSALVSMDVTIDNIVDTQAPIITIISPVNGSNIKGGNLTISATATDNEGVAGMSLYIDGILKSTSTSGSISASWNTRKVSAGIHTIKVEATDLSGNSSLSIVQVNK